MKKLAILLMITFCVSNFNSFAQNFDEKVRFTFDNTIATTNLLVFGATDDATDSLDRDLGELYIPPFPPPSPDLFAVFNWDTLDVSGKWTYVDLRSVPAGGDEFFHRYNLIIYKQPTSLVKVSWSPIGNHIKSARLYDKLGGFLIDADLRTMQESVINNQTIDKISLILDVVYSKKPVSVLDAQNDELEVYPNPANNEIYIDTQKDIYDLEIYDLLGNKTEVNRQSFDKKINIGTLNAGMYIMKIIDSDNKFITRKFVKLP